MPKAAFLALDLSIKHSRSFPSDLKIKKYNKQGKLSNVIFEILKYPKFSIFFFLLRVSATHICALHYIK